MIRPMNSNDYQGMYDLWTSIDGVGLRSLDDSKEGIEKFLLRNPNTCFVFDRDHQIIGTILSGHDGRRGYIYHLAVDSEQRFQGIGRQLVDKALESLELEGIKKVALVVFKHNKIGNAFWEKLGFKNREDLVYRNISIIEQ